MTGAQRMSCAWPVPEMRSRNGAATQPTLKLLHASDLPSRPRKALDILNTLRDVGVLRLARFLCQAGGRETCITKKRCSRMCKRGMQAWKRTTGLLEGENVESR